MKEAKFSKQLRDDIEDYFGYDKVHINLLPDMRRTGHKPYDFYFVRGKRFVACELKCEMGVSLAFNKIQPHQIDKVQEVNLQKCGTGVFVIAFPKKKCLFILKPLQLKSLIRKCKKKGKKSIPFDAFSFPEYYRKKIDDGTHWDIKGIWRYIKCL